jgi:hypothetical protein
MNPHDVSTIKDFSCSAAGLIAPENRHLSCVSDRPGHEPPRPEADHADRRRATAPVIDSSRAFAGDTFDGGLFDQDAPLYHGRPYTLPLLWNRSHCTSHIARGNKGRKAAVRW